MLCPYAIVDVVNRRRKGASNGVVVAYIAAHDFALSSIGCTLSDGHAGGGWPRLMMAVSRLRLFIEVNDLHGTPRRAVCSPLFIIDAADVTRTAPGYYTISGISGVTGEWQRAAR